MTRFVVAAALLFSVACDSSVDPNPVVSVTVAAPAATVRVGQTLQMAASVRDVNGVPVSATLRWSSLAPAIATVDEVSGLVTGVATGSTTIRGRAGGVNGDFALTVTP